MDTLTYTFTLPPLSQGGLPTPVLLPFGPLTMASIGSASIGVLVPFAIFLAVIFAFNYGLWHENVASVLGAAAPPPSQQRRLFRRGAAAAQGAPFYRYARVPAGAPLQPPSFFRAAA